jgi:uncharacterized membrane protein
MDTLKRTLKHLFAGRWQVLRHFPKSSMAAIEAAIKRSESKHMGELRFAVEAGLDIHELWHGISPRQRAIELFSQLRIWDTEHNSGVLIYLLLADRDVEIIADRGIHARVGGAQWQVICHEMEKHFRKGDFEQGALAGIAAISALLQQHFPAHGARANELPDSPVVL